MHGGLLQPRLWVAGGGTGRVGRQGERRSIVGLDKLQEWQTGKTGTLFAQGTGSQELCI